MINDKLIKLRMGLLIIASSLVVGCSTQPTTPTTSAAAGVLNLESPKLKQLAKTNRVIAVVSPTIAKTKQTQTAIATNPFQSYLQGNINSQLPQTKVNFNSKFSKRYRTSLNKALESSISEILVSKGFKLKGPFQTFDDLAYGDKKNIYLAFVPQINFFIENKITGIENKRTYSQTKGVIQITGDVVFSLIEPLTKQTFVKKRINLSDFNIQEPYFIEKNIYTPDLTTKLLNPRPDTYQDTTDVALTNAINKFYAKAINKINTYISREELLSFEKDILELKGLKRF